jgi:ubiquinone biosynthesis monooxygenase Coq7
MLVISALGTRTLKVNHAGEHGAVNIYRGQILTARLTAPELVAELREFKGHEETHREVFRAELARRGAPRCISYWLCAAGGFTLGILTGLLGRRAIAATTVAVESVVLRHLEHQLATLAGVDDAATTAIAAIVADERQHHDRSQVHTRGDSFWSAILTPVVAISTESVIWLGMRL